MTRTFFFLTKKIPAVVFSPRMAFYALTARLLSVPNACSFSLTSALPYPGHAECDGIVKCAQFFRSWILRVFVPDSGFSCTPRSTHSRLLLGLSTPSLRLSHVSSMLCQLFFAIHKSVAEWGIKQMLKMRDKQRILVDELTVCSDLIVAVQKVELGTLTAELDQLKVSASSILSECSTHYELGMSAMQRRDVSSVTQLAAGDLNLAVLLMSMSKCRSRAANIFGDLSSLSPQWDALETKMKMLEDETNNVLVEARSLVGEYEELDRDISGYLRPADDVGQYADLVVSTAAWTEFVSMFDLYLEELERRRTSYLRRAAEAEAFRRKMEEDAADEARARDQFDQIFNRPQVPALWRTGEFINEPDIPLQILPIDPTTVLPDVHEYRQRRELSRAAAIKTAQEHMQPKLTDRFAIPQPDAQDPEMVGVEREMANATLRPNTRPAFPPPPSAALDNSYAQDQALYRASPSHQPPSIQLRDSGNSLLGSDVSITESMLADSNALFHSASDQSMANHGHQLGK